ncbi:MAG TPA: GYD domain-containing protein [Blastocatellia bacterium]|nr:GYD domain-containing protein [Blastocatellia bacterium]
MVTYIVLWKFTDEGARNIKHTTGRSEVFKAQAEELGVQVKGYYWTLGGYDGVVILEAANDESIARLVMLICSLGSVHAETLRAFTQEEVDRILS